MTDILLFLLVWGRFLLNDTSLSSSALQEKDHPRPPPFWFDTDNPGPVVLTIVISTATLATSCRFIFLFVANGQFDGSDGVSVYTRQPFQPQHSWKLKWNRFTLIRQTYQLEYLNADLKVRTTVWSKFEKNR